MDFIIKIFNKPFVDVRTSLLSKLLTPYLEKGSSVLDVGSGDGSVAHNLASFKKLQIEGVDIVIQPKPLILTRKYNGSKLPYPSNSFDCVLLIDVLHHALQPELLLKEAARVSRNSILIKDHYWENRLDLLKLKVSDYIGNHPYGVPLPYRFFQLSQWREIFQSRSLKIVKFQILDSYLPFDICKHVIIKLRK